MYEDEKRPPVKSNCSDYCIRNGVFFGIIKSGTEIKDTDIIEKE